MTPPPIVRALSDQARFCEAHGSPFTALVLDLVAEDVQADGAFAPLFAPWAETPLSSLVSEAVALRIAGALHDIVLDGAEPSLAAVYPPETPRDPEALRSALSDSARMHRARIAAFMRSPPQTNEVRRSIALLGGFLMVAEETGLPLRCFEIGASAGLNLNWSRFHYDLGPAGAWGDPTSPVRLTTGWTGGSPPLRTVAQVLVRAGCDQNPIDVGDRAEARRLRAYVWADQAERMANLSAAITLSRSYPTLPDRADAAAWAPGLTRPQAGSASVLYHSIVWQYLSEASRTALAEMMVRNAREATAAAPFAWLRMEPTPDYRYEVRLTLWPGGEERRLAEVHPHAAAVHWLG